MLYLRQLPKNFFETAIKKAFEPIKENLNVEENLCLIKKFINVVQSLVQSGWEAYCSYQNLLTHMTEIAEIYVEIYDNVFLVYLIRKKDFQEEKRK